LGKINDGSWKEHIHDGITDSENYLQDMKRKKITILVWGSYHAASLSIENNFGIGS
jgi:hypothetical protein